MITRKMFLKFCTVHRPQAATTFYLLDVTN